MEYFVPMYYNQQPVQLLQKMSKPLSFSKIIIVTSLVAIVVIIIFCLLRPNTIKNGYNWMLKRIIIKTDVSFPDTNCFTNRSLLKANSKRISKEVERVLSNISKSPDIEDGIKCFHIIRNGAIINHDFNFLQQLLSKDDRIINASIRVLSGKENTLITKEEYKSLLTYNFGVKIPHIISYQLGNEQHKITKEGEGVLFDDTFGVLVKHPSDETIILSIQFLRELSFPWNEINRKIYQLMNGNK
jgi:hypothetical protein